MKEWVASCRTAAKAVLLLLAEPATTEPCVGVESQPNHMRTCVASRNMAPIIRT